MPLTIDHRSWNQEVRTPQGRTIFKQHMSQIGSADEVERLIREAAAAI
jgi:hypothetical protein